LLLTIFYNDFEVLILKFTNNFTLNKNLIGKLKLFELIANHLHLELNLSIFKYGINN